MASTASLRSRRSAAQLHALAGVEREIRANDHNGRRKYLLDFSQAFRSYDSVLASEQLSELLQKSDIILSETIMRYLPLSASPVRLSNRRHTIQRDRLCSGWSRYFPATSTF